MLGKQVTIIDGGQTCDTDSISAEKLLARYWVSEFVLPEGIKGLVVSVSDYKQDMVLVRAAKEDIMMYLHNKKQTGKYFSLSGFHNFIKSGYEFADVVMYIKGLEVCYDVLEKELFEI